MENKDSLTLLEKITELYGSGWKKVDCKWVDPTNGEAHSTIETAFKKHRSYFKEG